MTEKEESLTGKNMDNTEEQLTTADEQIKIYAGSTAKEQKTMKLTNTTSQTDNASTGGTLKRSRLESNKKSDDNDVFDGAYVYGLKSGDRVLVKWEIIENEGKSNERSVEHWWGATLLDYDGRTYKDDDDEEEEESDDTQNEEADNVSKPGPVAVHVLEYDEYPEGGFPEKSREEVLFLSAFELVDRKSMDILPYKRDGDDGLIDVFGGQGNGFEEMVNTVLTKAIQKSFHNFDSLPAAMQLTIAEKIAKKKAKLVNLMEEFFSKTGKRIGTPDDMKILIHQTMLD